MTKIFITGSFTGIGHLTAQVLIRRGHAVHLHARTDFDARLGRFHCPEAQGVFVADLASADATRRLAGELRAAGPWDTVIHNADHTGYAAATRRRKRPPDIPWWRDGDEIADRVFAVNTLAPYLLTCLVRPPARRYVFLSSGVAHATPCEVEDAGFTDTRLHNVLLAAWFARRLNAKTGKGEGGDVECCSVMHKAATQARSYGVTPDHIAAAVGAYVNLAEGRAPEGMGLGGRDGRYWVGEKEVSPLAEAEAEDEERQDRFVELLEGMSEVSLPE